VLQGNICCAIAIQAAVSVVHDAQLCCRSRPAPAASTRLLSARVMSSSASNNPGSLPGSDTFTTCVHQQSEQHTFALCTSNQTTHICLVHQQSNNTHLPCAPAIKQHTFALCTSNQTTHTCLVHQQSNNTHLPCAPAIKQHTFALCTSNQTTHICLVHQQSNNTHLPCAPAIKHNSFAATLPVNAHVRKCNSNLHGSSWAYILCCLEEGPMRLCHSSKYSSCHAAICQAVCC